MANAAISINECFCLFNSFNSLSNFKIKKMFQEIIAFLTLGIAVVFLIKKFFLKKKKKDKNCGGGDCGCH